MKVLQIQKEQWEEVKEIYLEAFPKRERKPFSSLRRGVRRGKVQLLTAVEGDQVLGFTAVIPYESMVMVDYLAVSGKIRSRGTGSEILQEVCRIFADKKIVLLGLPVILTVTFVIVLLIEKEDARAENCQQRIARRRFYVKNGFASSGIFTDGQSGAMEIMTSGGSVTPGEYLRLQKYALGRLFFRLSRIRITKKEGE